MTQDFVSYWRRLERRPLGSVRQVVIHCTEVPTLAESRTFAERILYPSKTGACGHFYLDRDGTVVQFVPLARMAHHVASFNRRSIGIELVNRGRYPRWYDMDHQEVTEPYSEAQYEALEELLSWLAGTALGRRLVLVGHEDLDGRLLPAQDGPGLVRRKVDPGPLFDWSRLAGSSLWRIKRRDRTILRGNVAGH